MFKIVKRLEIAGSHFLDLNYKSKCNDLHGHNWIIRIFCKTRVLNENGMVQDFTLIKKQVEDKLDHKYLNQDVDEFNGTGLNPTAENIAKWICDRIDTCYKVEVQESEGNIAIYEVEE